MAERAVRGIGYDAGVDYAPDFPSHPGFTEDVARRDLRAIREGLACDAVLVMATDPARLEAAGRIAADEGLTAWLQPRPVNQPLPRVREAVAAAAEAAERLRRDGAEVGLVVGCELTLSASGLLPGPTFEARGTLLSLTFPLLPLANLRLRRLLRVLARDARERFAGPLSYGAGSWEQPDWRPFDVVGVDRYRDARNAWRFEDDILTEVERAHRSGKPLFVLEFGTCAYRGASRRASEAFDVVGGREELTVPKRLVRDEQEQADYLDELFEAFDRAGVDGTFVWGFSEPSLTRDDRPGRDLDLASYGVVAVAADGTWAPKRAFDVVAARHRGGPRAKERP